MKRELKEQIYDDVIPRIWLLAGDAADWVAAMSTVVCELHNAFDYFHWTGFYRTVRSEHLQVGPYQGGHGCIDIPFGSGVCGTAARLRKTQLVRDVRDIDNHIACSATTQSEIVIPVISPNGHVIAVLDVDSDELSAFDSVDQQYLEALCKELGNRYGQDVSEALYMSGSIQRD